MAIVKTVVCDIGLDKHDNSKLVKVRVAVDGHAVAQIRSRSRRRDLPELGAVGQRPGEGDHLKESIHPSIMARAYRRASAINSAGTPAAPIATTMYCRPSTE